MIYDTTIEIFYPLSVSFISWGTHKIKFLNGIDYNEFWSVFTTDSSLANYLRMPIMGDNRRRVFLLLYLNAYGKTEIAALAQEGFLVFS